MSDKPKYQTPAILSFVDTRKGRGVAGCTNGSSPSGDCLSGSVADVCSYQPVCRSGGSAGVTCSTGSIPDQCQI